MIPLSRLENLRYYKYKSEDKSPLSRYILSHYWNWCSKLLPPWLAPNTISLLGLVCVYINIACVLILIPDLVGPGPRWLYLTFAIGVWGYSTLDNIDGKQARNTGMSSPLGELFDHVIDSLNCTTAGIVSVACMGYGSTMEGLLICFVTTVPMYMSTWETFHTHGLYLGYVNGPTEGVLLLTILETLSAIMGPQIWSQSPQELTPLISGLLLPEFIATATLRTLWLWFISLSSLIFHIPACIVNVNNALKNARKHAISKRQQPPSLALSFVQLVPMLTFVLAVLVWVCSPHSIILKDNHLVLFALACSFVFGRFTSRIILAHLTFEPTFPYKDLFACQSLLLTFALFFGIISRIIPLPSFIELICLWAFTIASFISFIEWSNGVINDICKFLNISCFTVPSANQQKLIDSRKKPRQHRLSPNLLPTREH